MADYVLVIQGTEVARTKDFEEAKQFAIKANEEFYGYVQEYISEEKFVDNKVYVYKETSNGMELVVF